MELPDIDELFEPTETAVGLRTRERPDGDFEAAEDAVADRRSSE